MKETLAAAEEIALHLRDSYTSSKGVHSETVVAAAAAITGEWSLWACGVPVPDGPWVVILETNALLVEGPEAASRLIVAAVQNAGGVVEKLPTGPELLARTAAAIGSKFPPLTVDQSHYPQDWSPLAAPRFRAKIQQIGEKNGLEHSKQIFVACAMATSMLISATAKALDPTIAGTLALEMMVAVSRMAPASTEKFLRDQERAQ